LKKDWPQRVRNELTRSFVAFESGDANLFRLQF
jgi:hypothetical protein